MLNILGICWDYLWMNKDSSKGNYDFRQNTYAQYLESLNRIVYAPKDFAKSEENIGNNIQIYYTRSRSKIFFPLDVLKISARIIKQKRIDIISAEDPCLSGFLGVLIKRKFNIPLCIQIHYDAIDNIYWIRQRKRHRLYNLLAKIAVRNADSIRVVSEEIKRKLLMLGINENKICVIPVQIDIDKFEKVNGNEVRSTYLQNTYNKIILFVGRLSAEKDIPTLLKAIKIVVNRYPSVLLLIVGDGAERKKIIDLIKCLNINNNVILVGSVNHDLVPKYFAACDIFVLPSLREARGNVAVEAAICKKPVITTEGTGAQEWVIKNDFGFTIKQGDYCALADKLLFLVSNTEISKVFGEAEYCFVKDKLKELNNEKVLIHFWEKAAKNFKKK